MRHHPTDENPPPLLIHEPPQPSATKTRTFFYAAKPLVPIAFALCVVALLSTSCTTHPHRTKVAAALGLGGGATRVPMVVDWRPEERGELEVAMRGGLAVVAYDDDGMRLLPSCSLKGSYGFVATTRKLDVVRMMSEDEVRVSLPTYGGVMAAKLGGELGDGKTLDVAMVMIGRTRTTRSEAADTELEGSCDGATHFVRGATLGAFVIELGERSHARTAAEMFGVEGAISVASSQSIRRQDGDLNDCMRSTRHATEPPDQCAALIRLELAELHDEDDLDEPDEDPEGPQHSAEENLCSKGFVFSEGRCVRTSAVHNTAYICSPKNPTECAQQCERGNAPSCYNLGHYQWTQTRNLTAAGRSMQRACDGGDDRGCVDLGVLISHGHAPTPTGTTRQTASADLYKQACTQGNGKGCRYLGELLEFGALGTADPHAARPYYALSCRSGDPGGCNSLGGLILLDGDPKTAADLFKRSCEGRFSAGCINSATLHELGLGTTHNAVLARSIYTKQCAAHPSTCIHEAIMWWAGIAGPQDLNRTHTLLRTSCKHNQTLACAAENLFFSSNHTLNTTSVHINSTYWQRTCNAGIARDCTQAAILLLASGHRTQGDQLLRLGCNKGDKWACGILSPRGY